MILMVILKKICGNRGRFLYRKEVLLLSFLFLFFSLHKVKCLDVLEVVGSEGKSAEFQVNVVGQLLSIVLLLKHPHLPSPWWVDGMG